MEAHNGWARLFHYFAHRIVERCPSRSRWNARWVNSGLGIVGCKARAPTRLDRRIGRGLDMAEEVHVKRSLRHSSDCGDLFAKRSGVSIAHGKEPSPPARQTAIARSGPCAPAIGA